jgi:hypothetical protein
LPGQFHFILTASKPAWGLRAAAAHYYHLFPGAFTVRTPIQGIWMPFSRISAVQGYQDFGFAFKEGDGEVAWDHSHGFLTFRYTEPMSWWMTIPAGVKRSYDVAIQYLDRYATGAIGTPETRRYALATRRSACFTDTGQFAVSIVDAPWSHGALFINNCSPALPDKPDDPNRAHVAWSDQIASDLYDHPERGIRGGEYLDSLEGWGDTRNFRADQFQYCQEPLTFDTATSRPCILQAFSTFEFTRWIANDVHRRGKLMFANSTPYRFYWLASQLDVMGTETNWLEGARYQPDSDAMMLYRRMIADRRPYLLLMNTDFDTFNHDMVEKYMKRCLFYGIFPSMFSHNAADSPYWENPAWYNRDRDLFRRYIPLIRNVALRGWQPVTDAISSRPDVWVERFGGGSAAASEDVSPAKRLGQGRPCLTVFNPGDDARTAVITMPAAFFGVTKPTQVWDRVNRVALPVKIKGHDLEVTVKLGPADVAVIDTNPGIQASMANQSWTGRSRSLP